MKLKKLCHAGLIFLSLASLSAANIQFPKPTGFINDYTGILTAADRQKLTNISQSLQQQTGAELAVAIVKTTTPLDSKLYAVKLFESWKIGQKGKDNGVLILLATDDRRIEIEVGYGLEGDLPDALVGRILDQYAVPNFKAGNLAEGLIQTAQTVSAIVAKDEAALPIKKTSDRSTYNNKRSSFISIILVMIGVIILGIILRKPGSIIFGTMGAFWGAGVGGLIGAIFGALLGFFFGFWGSYLGSKGGGFGGRVRGGHRGFGGRAGGGGFGGFGGGRSGGGGSGRSW